MYVIGTASASRLPAEADLGRERLLLALLEPAAVPLGEQLDDLGADVVARAAYSSPGFPRPTTKRSVATRQLSSEPDSSAAAAGAPSAPSAPSSPSAASASSPRSMPRGCTIWTTSRRGRA